MIAPDGKVGHLFVAGVPVPQGSMRAFVNKKTGRAIVTGSNKKTKPWRQQITDAFEDALTSGIAIPRPEAVRLDVEFVMPRRVAEPKRKTPPHTRKPDRDKLLRAVQDALTGTLYEDDSQVVAGQTIKRTAAVGERPGVLLAWTIIDETPSLPINVTNNGYDENVLYPGRAADLRLQPASPDFECLAVSPTEGNRST